VRTKVKPKAGKSKAQAIKWSRDVSAPLSGSMAKAGDQARKGVADGQERKQEGIRQSRDEEEFHACFPMEQSRGFKSQLGFGKAQRHFDLPAPGISKNNLPGLLSIFNSFGGEQIPRLAPRAGS